MVFDRGTCPCTRDIVLRRVAAIHEERARLEEIRTALCRLLGDDLATGTPAIPGVRPR